MRIVYQTNATVIFFLTFPSPEGHWKVGDVKRQDGFNVSKSRRTLESWGRVIGNQIL